MPTTSLLANRSRRTPSSAIRDLLEQARRPGMISLAGGLPDPEMFPVAQLSAIAAKVIAENGERALQYGPTNGDKHVREVLADLFDHATADEVIITTGSQQGLDLIARSLFNPNDTVVVGDSEYLGALQVFGSYDVHLAAIPIDSDGLDTAELERQLLDGLRPKACYLVPHFHNPTGASISRPRRTHLDDLATKYGFIIIEDDPYRALFYEGDAPAPRPAHDMTVYLRSISKVLTPGLRIGALSGPDWLNEAIVIAKQSVDLHTSPVTQLMVAEALESDWIDDHVATLRKAYGTKQAVLADALHEAFGDRVSFTPPTGGMFLWAKFDDADTSEWLTRCLDQGVCFVPGDAFAVDQDLGSYARLSFVTASEQNLIEAVKRMAASL